MRIKEIIGLVENEKLELDNLQHELAQKDINSTRSKKGVHVHPDDHKQAHAVAKKLGLHDKLHKQ